MQQRSKILKFQGGEVLVCNIAYFICLGRLKYMWGNKIDNDRTFTGCFVWV
jgi:hypothetical protein